MALQTRTEVRKQQILGAAEKVFARKGFSDSTISEIAQEAGLSDATIYEYFSSKEELLFSGPLETIRTAYEQLRGHLEFIRGAANRLRGIIYGYLSFYQGHPDFASILMLILKHNRNFLKTEAYQLMRRQSRVIIEVVEEGIASGEFKPDTDPYLVRAVVLGTIEHTVTSWVLFGKPENLVAMTDSLSDLTVDGIRKESRLKNIRLNVVFDENGEGAFSDPLPQGKTRPKN
ncbi:MAG: TetR/AcrR family transcriptional regulator [Deltaproteobacteria bacterium]|nr:TetR/AcrR family transcriptional regulator [Deltaproteobacteria bacterium]